MCQITDSRPAASIPHPGDRVRIREGYLNAGVVGYYLGKSEACADDVWIDYEDDDTPMEPILAASIEPYPHTRSERIERAIEDYDVAVAEERPMTPHSLLDDVERAALYAILEAGV